MKRSGHHAIMNWLAAHTGQQIFNNVCFGWEDKKLLTMVGKKEAVSGIANIEDFNPEDWEKYDFDTFPFVENCRVVLVIRSANNWLASCYARKYSNREDHKDVYKFLAKKYTNDRKDRAPSRIDLYCKQLEFTQYPKIVGVTFDDWFKSELYRKWLAEQLNIEWSKEADETRKSVSVHGKGSSFDGTNFKSNANQMDVLNRDNDFVDDYEYKMLSSYMFVKAMSAVKKAKLER